MRMHRISRLVRNPIIWLAFSLLLAMGLKIWLVMGGWAPFNADEAVVALMARHIDGGARPIFFYGQAYMGSLDAFLVAGAFAILGQHVWVVRLVQGLLYMGFLATTYLLGRYAFGKRQVGALAALLLAVPTVNVALYTTVSLGGYGEALLLGNMILLCALLLKHYWDTGVFPGALYVWFLFGFLVGLGLWTFGLTLVYSLTAGVFLLIPGWRFARAAKPIKYGRISLIVIITIAGLFIGSLPWWIYAAREGLARLLTELGGEAIAGVEGLGWLSQIGRHLASLILFGSTVSLGLRPPWNVSWLGLPLLPFMLIFWAAVVIFAVRRIYQGPNRSRAALLAGVAATLGLLFVLSPFGADPSGRYFLPLAGPLALFAADMIVWLRERIGVWAFGLVGLVVFYQFWGIAQSALKYPPGLTTQFYEPSQIDHRYDQTLIDFLLQHGETRGYSNYWVAYPLAFKSAEKLIYVPRLPYHLDFRYTERDDRYAPYDEEVYRSERAAYITTNHPDLDEYLREQFAQNGITWKEEQLGEFHVFYALSAPVRPAMIGLGMTTSP
jgi:4-amino-4-deoxy-L-arabinose transferase-like glycosyltransferase